MLEVCIDTIESALSASAGGAARLEVCSSLAEGGLTPSFGMFKTIRSIVKIPLFVMLRPKPGNDFEYSDLELDSILADMEILSEYGADGFVFGALRNGCIDTEACSKIITAAKGLPVTFHRAFDVTDPKDMIANVYLISSLGFSRVLTSGLARSAFEGVQNIKSLQNAIGNGLIVMPGCGITTDNADEILSTTGCKEFHASARKIKYLPSGMNPSVKMSKEAANEDFIYIADEATVKKLVLIGQQHNLHNIL